MLKWQFSVLSYQSQYSVFSRSLSRSRSRSFQSQFSVCSHSIQFTVRGIVTFSFNFAPLRLCEKIFMDLSGTQYAVCSLQFAVSVAVSVSVAVAVFSLQYSVCSHSIQFTVRGIVTFSFNFAPLRLCEKIFMDLSETQYSVFSLQFSVAVAVASKNPCIFVWLREPLRNN